MSLRRLTAIGSLLLMLGGCGGGGGGGDGPDVDPGTPSCDGSCTSASSLLSTGEVGRVIAQAVAEATARGSPATIAVVDRVGNVLAVFRMNGAPGSVTLQTAAPGSVSGGLEGIDIVPATMAAITKAITAAYLSSEGNAFSTRTASQIVQRHFNPGELLTPGGPLFGVQLSQLPCSDLLERSAGSPGAGPHRSPLGLAADPGGLPLYKAGAPVGGVGIVADGIYGLDADILDHDADVDELIAVAAAHGFAAPAERRADRITADGKTLRFSDAAESDLQSTPATAPGFSSIDGVVGGLAAVPGYSDGTLHAGTAFGQPASGIRADTLDYPGLDAWVLVDDANIERWRPRAGTEASGGLSAAEVRELLRQALSVANRARAQIRRPLGTPARVSIAVVDSNGEILGIVRSRDAPVFGTDVALQKARTASLLSSDQAAATLAALPSAVYLDGGLTVLDSSPPGAYTTRLRDFLGLPGALGDGTIAWTARAVGNLSRPNFPDGVDGNPEGPLSRPAGAWSPLATGLQLDVVYNALIQHVAFVAGLTPDVPQNCSGVGGFDAGFPVVAPAVPLANGLQIFPGAVPLYRDQTLVGAIGVSGDGVDQDDMVAFLGTDAAGRLLGSIGNAPATLRSDTLTPQGNRLRYVSCPQSPFIDSDTQAPCNGL